MSPDTKPDLSDAALDALVSQLESPSTEVGIPVDVANVCRRAASALRALRAEHATLREALEAVVRCEATFSRDPLEHARNAVAQCREVAEATLARLKGDQPLSDQKAAEALLERLEVLVREYRHMLEPPAPPSPGAESDLESVIAECESVVGCSPESPWSGCQSQTVSNLDHFDCHPDARHRAITAVFVEARRLAAALATAQAERDEAERIMVSAGDQAAQRIAELEAERDSQQRLCIREMEKVRDLEQERDGLDSGWAAEREGIRRLLSGEQIGASTDITEEPSYGYGRLDDNGFWEFQVPPELVALCRKVRDLEQRQLDVAQRIRFAVSDHDDGDVAIHVSTLRSWGYLLDPPAAKEPR